MHSSKLGEGEAEAENTDLCFLASSGAEGLQLQTNTAEPFHLWLQEVWSEAGKCRDQAPS